MSRNCLRLLPLLVTEKVAVSTPLCFGLKCGGEFWVAGLQCELLGDRERLSPPRVRHPRSDRCSVHRRGAHAACA